MVVKLFLSGNPGSGKSTIARHIVKYSQEHEQWQATHFNDYRILRHNFENDHDNSFWPDGHQGFIVMVRSLYNTVLKTLEENINQFYSINNGLAIIEFARSNYEEAFNQFDPGFLKGSYVLYLDADIKTCISRTQQRFLDAKTEDDYHVSEYVFEYYHHNKNREYLASPLFKELYGVKRVEIVENSGSLSSSIDQVNSFVTFIHDQEREEFYDREPSQTLAIP